VNARGVRSLAELAAKYASTRDKRRRIDIRCGYCDSVAERIRDEREAEAWFVSHKCVTAAPGSAGCKCGHGYRCALHRPDTEKQPVGAEPGAPDPAAVYWPMRTLSVLDQLAFLAGVPSGDTMKEMDVTTRMYGGRRLGLTAPTAEQHAHAARVDETLQRLLGGVPSGKPPRTGRVVVFPMERVRAVLEHAA